MTIRIVTDSTCDLPDDVIARYQITVAPAYLNIGDKSYRDGLDITREAFYAGLPTFPTHPTTAAPSPSVFTDIFEQLVAEGATTIIAIHIAERLSAFLNMARLGAEGVQGARIIPFDSQNLSMGIGLQVLAAAEDVATGRSLDDVLQRMEARRARTRVYAGLDTLEFLRRSGRVSIIQAGLGSLLQIKPIMLVNQSEVTKVDQVRTRSRVPGKLVEIAAHLGSLEALTILHANALEEAAALHTQLQPYFPSHQTPLTLGITPALGVHIGPGAIGFAVITQA